MYNGSQPGRSASSRSERSGERSRTTTHRSAVVSEVEPQSYFLCGLFILFFVLITATT